MPSAVRSVCTESVTCCPTARRAGSPTITGGTTAQSPFTGLEQAPVPGSQLPASWHGSLAAQLTAVPPTQAPPWQVSVCVQASPSLHGVPLPAGGFEHAPVAG